MADTCPTCGSHVKVHTSDERTCSYEPVRGSPTYWPGDVEGGIPGVTDHEETGPIGAGTPHARMCWFWDRMHTHDELIAELTGWGPISSTYRFEAAIADAFDKLAEPVRSGEPTDEELLAAYVAGFAHSGEGYNGEWPYEGRESELPAELRPAFENWLSAAHTPRDHGETDE